MLRPADPVASLSAAAALASGWPRIRVLGTDPSVLEAAFGILQAHLGPLPQADHIEPFDATTGEPWELRVDVPGLDPVRWLTVREALAGFAPELAPGEPLETTAADDLGARTSDWIDAGPLAARLLLDADGQLQRLDLQRTGGHDEAVRAVERDLALALQAADPRLALQGTRGPDTLDTVMHRASGRLGLELAFDARAWQGLDGDEVLALRRAAVQAVGEVLVARHDHPVLRLAPDLHGWLRMDALHLVVWIVAAPVPLLAGDAPLDAAPPPDRPTLEALAADLAGWVHDLELQVVTDTPEVLCEALEHTGVEGVVGGPPRWVQHAGRWRFVPTWRVAPEALAQVPVALLDAPHRWAPGCPVGREADDAWLQRSLVWGRRGMAVRFRDTVRDRDLAPAVTPRLPVPADAALLPALVGALGPHRDALRVVGGLPATPVALGTAQGLELRFQPPGSATHDLLRALIDGLPCGPWVHWWYPPSGELCVALWHPGPGPEAEPGPSAPPRWR